MCETTPVVTASSGFCPRGERGGIGLRMSRFSNGRAKFSARWSTSQKFTLFPLRSSRTVEVTIFPNRAQNTGQHSPPAHSLIPIRKGEPVQTFSSCPRWERLGKSCGGRSPCVSRHLTSGSKSNKLGAKWRARKGAPRRERLEEEAALEGSAGKEISFVHGIRM